MASMVMVSGGRTGADRAALDWAMSRGIEQRGWCASERRADDGPIPLKYRLREIPSSAETEPAEFNVRIGDGGARPQAPGPDG